MSTEISTNLRAYFDSSKTGEEMSFFIVAGTPEKFNTIPLDTSLVRQVSKQYQYSVRTETLLIEAVRNFIKKMNFFELNDSLDENEISEDVFYKLLEEKSNKYVITLKDMASQEDANVIVDIMNKIGSDLREFTTSEVSEMFSVKESQLLASINTVGKHLR